MKLKILKEVVILMIITTIMVSFVHADEDPYEKCVDECYSTCFADISGCYEYCKQDCKNPNLSSSEWKHCTINDCVKYKGDKKMMETCIIKCAKTADKIKG
uniref:Uncharacterized protein n=1 Tax=Nicotiana tabacum TaxID=4097 RepID=A0A1S4D9C5_TOBAC|nr:uncharacterized protein LOC104103951 [Nicotiana tomentosiformis]XP_016509819.1 PREDICTED: uncharacterized protein LOC107827234 [Nicotiana tabacum]